MTTTDTPTVDNGVNVEALLGAREALTNHPEAASFQWRASCEWVRGTHSRTMITDFSGLGAEDNGPTPPEIALAALASCLTAGVATVASNRGVQLRSVKATVTAGMDLQGILGIDGDVRNGFDQVTVTYDIDADASRADLEAILVQSQKRSAVFDVITNPTTVQVTLA